MTERDSARGDAIARARAYDAALARRGISPERSEQIRQALQERAHERRFAARLRWWPVLAFAAGALLMAALLLRDDRSRPDEGERLVDERSSEPRSPTSDERQPEPEPAPESTCASAGPGSFELAVGECVQADGVRLTALLPSRYTWASDRVELDGGELSIDVEPRADDPLLVGVGEAEIVVIGTSFVIHRDAEAGWISLLEGHVRVTIDDVGKDLRAGERLDWSEVEPAPAPARPGSASDADEGLTELLAEVAELRRRGEYEAAVERLRAGERAGWSARARQVVSFEIGTLLERQLGDFDAACRHWARHQARFPTGRHASIVARSIERMRCEERPSE